MMHPSIEIYQEEAIRHINVDFEIDHLEHDLAFTEGPVWNEQGFYLFSDTKANCIYRLQPGQPKEIFISNSGTNDPNDPFLKEGQAGSNALAYDAQGRLLVCRHGSHDIAVYKDGALLPYITTYNNKSLNSPNDFILHRNGTLYFSDPPYGLKDSQLNPEKFQPLAGVYYAKDGEVKLLCDKYQYPNGVCLSPAEDILYICSNKPFEKFISMYSTITHEYLGVFAEENSDGIECDRVGNIYLCNKDGLIMLNPKGERLALIKLPTIPANACWGGPHKNDLFVVARENIFLIKNLQL